MFEANGVADRVELRRANSRDVTVEEPAVVIIHEVLGIDPFRENVLPCIEDARERLLAPGGRLIPFALDVECVGFEVGDRPYLDRARACAELSELGGLYGVDFAAYRRALNDARSDPFPRPLERSARRSSCRASSRPGRRCTTSTSGPAPRWPSSRATIFVSAPSNPEPWAAWSSTSAHTSMRTRS